MTGRLNPTFLFIVTCLSVAMWFANAQASSDTTKMNVFERFRYEMTVAHEVAAPKFMSEKALAKWNRNVARYFARRDRRLSHYFAFSMLVPKINQGDFYVVYFNPWVDGALLTKWKKTGEEWKMEDFYFASGERVRGEITPKSVITGNDTLPVWLRFKGKMLDGLFLYYNDMSLWLTGKDVREYMAWLSLSDKDSLLDLTRVSLRMRTRLELALSEIAKTNSGPVLSGAFSKLKYDALIKDKQKLATYSRHADIIADLPEDVTKTWRENWYFKNKDTYKVILSSPIQPRLFLSMDIHELGKIKRVFLGDLEVMSNVLRKKTVKAKTASATPPVTSAAPSQPTRKIQRYKATNGDQIEIITEKRGGKVIMTTRRNGQVTEILTF